MKRYTLFLAMALTVITLQSTFTSTASADTISIQTLLSPMLLAEVQSDNTTTEQPVEHRTTWGALKAIYRGNTSPKTSVEPSTATAVSQLRKPVVAPMAAAFPTSYWLNQVPWISQYSIPGSNLSSHACGQTDATMIDAYYKHRIPVYLDITANNYWLMTQYGSQYYPSPNSHDTWFGGANPLGNLIGNHLGYAYYVQNGTSANDLTRIFRAVRAGVPVIVGVLENDGLLSTSGGYPHWVIIVGYQQDTNEVIINDPGTSYPAKGYFRHYTISYFDKSWATQGRVWAPVEKGMCVFY